MVNQLGLSTFTLASPFSDAHEAEYQRTRGYGYDVIEVCIEDPAIITGKAIREYAQKYGLEVSICGAFGPDRDLSHPDAEVRQRGIDYVKACIDIAAEVGSPNVAGPMYAPTGQTRMLTDEQRSAQLVRAAASIAECAHYASQHGVALAVEPLNRFETDLINTVEQALNLCDLVDAPNVGLLLDTFHMNIEEKSLGEAIRRAGDRVFHFQVSENDRGTPGSGHVPWEEVFTALQDINYQGQIVVESFLPTVKEIARAVSLWRPVATSMTDLHVQGLAFLRTHVSRD